MTSGERHTGGAPAVRGVGVVGRSLGSREARLTGAGLLTAWQDRNRSATLPHAAHEIRQAGNLDNFRRVTAGSTGAAEAEPYRGRYPFLDTDVYKTLEGLVYELARDAGEAGDARACEDFYEESVALIEAAQAPDGYLGTYFQGPDAQKAPWEDLSWGHELYNLGHLTQAAVAAARQLGDERLLRVARRFADLAVERYGEDGEPLYCGHPEVEMALVELYRETGEERYLRQAELFVERRGSGRLRHTIFPASYFQDAEPLRELTSVTGHAVRMVYLAAGATDVALERGDTALLDHLEALWDDMVATKLYLTGGLGARHSDEAVGDRYELPSERAYAETCAAIGTIQWGWRLFLATGRADVLDVVERVLYNAFAVGTSLDGRAFFYDNPLQRRPDHEQRSGAEQGGEPLRRAWFGCPCCPPNIVRFVSQLQDHLATVSADAVTIGLYAPARLRTGLLDLTVETAYPWDGRVTVTVDAVASAPRDDARAPESAPAPALVLRVPAWARGASLRVNDEPAAPATQTGPTGAPGSGWLRLSRAWAPGDRVVLDLPTRVRAVRSHPYLDATRGSLALLRGPLVYCVEQQDAGAPVDDLVLTPADLGEVRVETEAETFGTPVSVLRAALAAVPPVDGHGYGDGEGRGELYPEVLPDPEPAEPAAPPARVPVRFVPYFLWGNRQPGAMRVWLRHLR
ncbi:glycoside hydrolase family 127 protein [Streptomyces sp. 4N509B]|uniref:glycoside hydrolase family 127 protein n=1 Tax=Streptomyces sp. 4N509B TaxID=3457413 RepID=UPI003FD0CC0A